MGLHYFEAWTPDGVQVAAATDRNPHGAAIAALAAHYQMTRESVSLERCATIGSKLHYVATLATVSRGTPRETVLGLVTVNPALPE